MKVVTSEEMKAEELRCLKQGITEEMLINNAGLAIANVIDNEAKASDKSNMNILTLVGPGNNGMDGIVASKHLLEKQHELTIYLCSNRSSNKRKAEDLGRNGARIVDVGSDPNLEELSTSLQKADIVIDAILGTGTSRPVGGTLLNIIEKLSLEKESRPDLFSAAIDIPTGLHANSGSIDSLCPTFDITVALGFPKIGLFSLEGGSKAGRVVTVDIGIPHRIDPDHQRNLITSDWVSKTIPMRPQAAHKGTFGKVLVVAGSEKYVGAAYLACAGAVRCGAGLVTLACPKSIYPIIASKLSEVTYLPMPESNGMFSTKMVPLILNAITNYDVLLMGPGMGLGSSIENILGDTILSSNFPSIPTILDADGLNNVRNIRDWQTKLHSPTVITPHMAEMSRLLNIPLDQVEANRFKVTTTTASQWNISILLKGPYTLVADPNGSTFVNPFANPNLASAGTGDVLSGIIAGLAAQDIPIFEAAACGAYIHGATAEKLRDKFKEGGMIASDLLPEIPKMLGQVRS